MPRELIGVSASKALSQVCDSLNKAQVGLESILSRIRGSINPPTAGGPASGPQLIAEVEADLSRVRADVQTASGIVGMLESVQEDSADSLRLTGDNETSMLPSNSEMSIALSGVSATSIHRMSEIKDSLKLTDQQALERCVATQHYVDSKLHEGWRFFIQKGRERRAISFPGQSSA